MTTGTRERPDRPLGVPHSRGGRVGDRVRARSRRSRSSWARRRRAGSMATTQAFSLRFLGVFLVACASGALLWLPPPRPGLHEWSRLLAWCAVAIGVQFLLRSIAPLHAREPLCQRRRQRLLWFRAGAVTGRSAEALQPGCAGSRRCTHKPTCPERSCWSTGSSSLTASPSSARLARCGPLGRWGTAPLRLHARPAGGRQDGALRRDALLVLSRPGSSSCRS